MLLNTSTSLRKEVMTIYTQRINTGSYLQRIQPYVLNVGLHR
jgi:hypothetical protein